MTPVTARLSPVILADQAGEFLIAAQRVFELAKPLKVSIPAYFLAARSIELALKSFLVLKGHSVGQLKNISHNLERALEEATALGLHSVLAPSAEQVTAIQMVNAYYNSKDLEYLTTGFKSYPDRKVLLAVAQETLEALKAPLRAWRPPA